MGIRSEWNRSKKFRKGIIPNKSTPATVSKTTASRNPFTPNIVVEVEHHRITGYGRRVIFPSHFDGWFKRGERILYWHLESTDIPTIRKLLNKIKDPVLQQRLKQLGFAGFVGDVPNDTLGKLYERYGATRLKAKPPALIALRERLRYAQNVVKRKYPSANLSKPFQRVALRFE